MLGSVELSAMLLIRLKDRWRCKENLCAVLLQIVIILVITATILAIRGHISRVVLGIARSAVRGHKVAITCILLQDE